MNENNMKTPAQPNAKPAPDSLSQQAASALQQSMQGFAAELAQQQESDQARETHSGTANGIKSAYRTVSTANL